MKTPVAFLIYNRPDLTERVFAEIRMARPPVMLIVADGPRDEEDREKCEKTRAVVKNIDWPCRIERNYEEVNLGCRKRVSTGLDWVFGLVEEAIIIEDDCLPHATFFLFCEVLLDHYRDDERIGHIGGTDNNRGATRGDGSYYFSRYTSIWGWATWRRAWQAYDVDLPSWPELKKEGRHHELFGSVAEAGHFEQVWDDIHSGVLDTWDAQWLYCRLRAGSLSVAPNGNLVTNIGFRADATHTVLESHPFAELQTRKMDFPLIHPEQIRADVEADRTRAEAEFLKKADGKHAWLGKLTNKHIYGQILRAIPGVGGLWASMRSRSGAQAGDGR